MQLLSSIVCRNIYESIVLPYDKDIDMKKIQGSFMLIATNEGKVFLVAYKYNDNYKVPLESIESEENIEKLNNDLNRIVGIVETSLFVHIATSVLSVDDGHVRVIK